MVGGGMVGVISVWGLYVFCNWKVLLIRSMVYQCDFLKSVLLYCLHDET
jgi:hypothetical protein